MHPLLCFVILTGFISSINSTEVTLLDTRDTRNGGSLEWQTFTETPSPSPHFPVGWRERSFTEEQTGETVRIYTVCNVDLDNVDNWVRTPYIARGQANRLYVEMRFTMRTCQLYPDPENLHQCRESFKLYYYEAESDFANAMMPTWDTDTYSHADVVAADRTFENIDDAIINVEVRSVPITRRGVYFAFHDEGACTALLSIRIYYVLCEATTVSLAVFPNTTAGPELTSIVQEEGRCVPHAAIEHRPSYLCKADGSWYYPSGGCKCMPGYEPQGDKKCSACAPGTYKWRTDNYACATCPLHSIAPNNGSVECGCETDYYRSLKDDKSKACTRPPSEVRNISTMGLDQSAVNLTWSRPADLGGRTDILYSINCLGCPPDVLYRPKKDHLNQTRVTVAGLVPNTKYKFVIVSENGVSQQAGTERSAAIVIQTEPAVPSKVHNIRIASVGSDSVTVAWEHPKDPYTKMEEYHIKYFQKERHNTTKNILTTKFNQTISGLRLQTEYVFMVRGKTARGWGEFSHPISATTGHIVTKVDVPGDNPVGIIAGSAVAVVVCMIIVIIMVIIFLRRNRGACNEKNVSDCDTLQYSNVQCPPVIDGTHMLNGGLTVPLFQPPGSFRTYIDPHTYEDPQQAVREFTKEIDASYIVIESVIGGGEFGDVCKGKLRLNGKAELSVAIKTLKAGASDKNRLDFLTEASIMGQFDDPNVIYLEGVVTKSNPIMIVTEFMENGSLDTFLRNNDGKFTVIQLTGMMRGIASGMRYLSDMGYVHRDLAARNILVNESLVCKVADFGLSREIESDTTEGAYTTKGGKIPVRWTAPEAIAYRKFTSASDVWSYGVVMWEVMSYGERPYWNWSNQDVIKAVEKNFRLPPPMDCPEAIHQLMLDCWQKERSHRPKFSAIVKTLDKLIRSPELLRKIAKPRPHNYFDSNVPDLTNYDSIEEWLTSIKMERYIDHFLQAGFTTMDQVAALTLKDLVTLGVTLVGHQKKIMNSVQTLRAQMSGAQVSEGFLV